MNSKEKIQLHKGMDCVRRMDFEKAIEYFQIVTASNPDMPEAWNNLGVLETRAGNNPAAAQAFDKALHDAPTLASALANASALYQRMGQPQLAARLDSRLQQVHGRDPFHQFMQGVAAERRGDYAQAVAAYRHAIQLYGNAHQFHFGLARAYFLDGDNRRAMRELARARELGGNDHVRTLYQSKLDSLRRLGNRHAMR